MITWNENSKKGPFYIKIMVKKRFLLKSLKLDSIELNLGVYGNCDRTQFKKIEDLPPITEDDYGNISSVKFKFFQTYLYRNLLLDERTLCIENQKDTVYLTEKAQISIRDLQKLKEWLGESIIIMLYNRELSEKKLHQLRLGGME